MSRFKYKAKQGPQDIIDGTVEAQDVDQAIKKVLALGYTPLDVVAFTDEMEDKKGAQKNKVSFSISPNRISRKSVVQFTRQLCDLVDAAIPLLRALQLVENQTKNLKLKKIIGEMAVVVRDGGNLSDALNQYPDIFPKLYVNMIKSGEVSGKLGLTLGRLAGLVEKELEIRNKVTASLAYPAFILVIGVLTVFVLMTFVIPRMTALFDDFDQMLPLPTVILITLSGFMAKFWWLIVGIAAAGSIYFKRMLGTQRGKVWFDKRKLTVPLLKDLIIDVEVGRFARILGTLLESGVVIVTALQSVIDVVNNEILKSEIKAASSEVSNGASLMSAFKNSIYFPETAVNMIAVGEETGQLENSLYKLADTLERQSENTTKTFISLLGPAVLVVVIAIVGFIIVSLLLPILEMNLVIV